MVHIHNYRIATISRVYYKLSRARTYMYITDDVYTYDVLLAHIGMALQTFDKTM